MDRYRLQNTTSKLQYYKNDDVNIYRMDLLRENFIKKCNDSY